MSTFLQLTFAGVNVGALYMLVALGMVVTYQVSRVESLAQGVFVVFSSLVFATVHDTLGLPLAVAVLASLATCAAIAVVLHDAEDVVHAAELRPKSVVLAIAIASSASFTLYSVATGPNASSRCRRISGVTAATTVGG